MQFNMWLLILLSCQFIFMNCHGYRCGLVCECIRERHLISCSHRNLRTYPLLPEDPVFTGLDLTFNRITQYPDQELLQRFQQIDISGNPLICSNIKGLIGRIVVQDSCIFNTTPFNSKEGPSFPETVNRKVGKGTVLSLPHSPSSPESQRPVLTIAISSVSGLIGFMVFTSMSIGLYLRYRRMRRRRNSDDHDSITSSNVSISIPSVPLVTLAVDSQVACTPGQDGEEDVLMQVDPTDYVTLSHSSQRPLSPPPPPPPPPDPPSGVPTALMCTHYRLTC